MAWDERFYVVCRGSQGSGTRWWCTDARRLSIHKTDPQFSPLPRPKMSNLRSFSVFGAATFSQLFPRGMPSLGFKLLRVLELRGTPIVVIPNEVFDLFNLRHLGLSLPCKISKLQSLRHLFINNKIEAHKHRITRFIFRGETLTGGWKLKGLQTLRTVSCNTEIARKIGRLTQMRSLSIMGVRSVHGMDLCTSITKMERILHLCIIAVKEHMGEVLCLDFLSPPPSHLLKLLLIRQMEGVPRARAEVPRAIVPRVEGVARVEDAELGECGFLARGMPELRELQFRSCVELMEPLKGVHYLTKLQQLSLVLMPEEFIEKMRRMDRSSSAFKHIADVKYHSRGADGRWTVQLL
ncbi:hypothetical protein QJS10_CPA08g01753 [Acorus calamus]|uniref:Disease resistance R13L4/SHOC-2-like LRR domain-containing protein n=1 Tax=Acorus calamus TaxID=4465 RepID=A0AAV9E9Y4_ACOCL|nr:hypothetical protein QJS10_CPA08g01753 [Acorus calamus]